MGGNAVIAVRRPSAQLLYTKQGTGHGPVLKADLVPELGNDVV